MTEQSLCQPLTQTANFNTLELSKSEQVQENSSLHWRKGQPYKIYMHVCLGDETAKFRKKCVWFALKTRPILCV